MPQSLTNLLVHIIFSTADRQPLLNEIGLREELHRYLGGIVNEKGGQSLGVGGVADHVHLLIVLPKTLCVSDLVRDLKRASSIWIKSKDLSQQKFSWQGGYGAFSIGQTEVDAVQTYIRNQSEHHKKRSFQEEYLVFLKKYGVAYDERYLWE